MAARKTNDKQRTKGTPKPKPIAFPPPPQGFVAMPSEPLWWEGPGSIEAVFWDVEVTERDGERVQALVLITSSAVRARDNWGDVVDVAADHAIRIDAPTLLKFAPAASDEAEAPKVIVHCADDRGRKRWAMYFSEARVPRASVKIAGLTPQPAPQTQAQVQPPAAQKQAQA
jgi:hypothetical protein